MPPQIQEVLKRAAKELYPLVTKELSDQSTKKYNNDTWTLSELDEWKNTELPQTLKRRWETKGTDLHLTKDELVLLMDWKLAKGKFRPTLPGLIRSNNAESVVEWTTSGYSQLMKYLEEVDRKNWKDISMEDYKGALRSSLKSLCNLRGVGPATASLILSLLSGVTIFSPPFFSDESFMYYIRDTIRPSQPIKYTAREYIEEFIPLLVRLSAESIEASPDLLEKGAWAIKMYHLYKIDRLADLKLPFEIDSKHEESFGETREYLIDSEPKKRTGTTKQEPSQKKKKK